MELYLIRHADAVTLGEGGIIEDAARPLTPKGEAQARFLGDGLARWGIRLEVLLTSPLVRARQTADGIAQHLTRPAPEVRLCEDLAPGGKRRRLARGLKDIGKKAIGVVGHQPDLGEFAAWLIGSKKAQIDFAKAGVANIVCDEEPGKGEGRLVWLAGPEWFES